MKLLNAEQMRAADAHAINDIGIPSIDLMENAGKRCVEVMLRRVPEPVSTVVICGKGNNGGDGLVVARLLEQAGWNPTVLLLGSATELKNNPAVNWKKAVESGVTCVDNLTGKQLSERIAGAEWIVDAVFGTGLSKPLETFFSDVVQRINRSGKKVLSIDVPSGLSSDTGEIPGPAVRATITIALASLKYCHVLSPACRMCGETYAVDIGIPTEASVEVITSQDVKRVLPHRSPDSHKGTFGHVAVVAGSSGKSGAAYMTGKAALRCGAGLVTVVAPANVQPIIASLGPELMTEKTPGQADYFSDDAAGEVVLLTLDKSAVAIGPGMGTENVSALFFRQVVSQIQAAVVIDADGLNLLAQDLSAIRDRKPFSTVLTPHPGEMARLLQTDTKTVQRDRVPAAKRLAEATQSIVVLKGYRTVIADPRGRVWINLTGGAALASAGTGDILTGAIAGFLAQKLAPSEAAIAAVYLHGLTANLFEARYPQQALNAMDILRYWNRAFAFVRSGKDVEGEYLGFHFQ